MDEPVEVLQKRLNELKATQASLQADLLRAKERPSTSQIKKAAKRGRQEVPPTLQELGRRVAEVEERCILYRTAGWTVFEIDLDVGKRQRNARRQATTSTPDAKTALGLGVRLETFHEGRFYEPYYLIFAKPSQLLKHGAKILATSVNETTQEKTPASNRRSVKLMRHTIPHFVPLSDILRSYLHSSADDDDDDDDEPEGEGAGGLQLLDKLMQREGLFLFLSHLHAYLQSFVSRRQQAIALAQLPLPGLAHSSLRAFGNDSFGQLSIRWDLPVPTQKDLQMYQQHGDILYGTSDGQDAVQPAANQRTQGAVNSSLEVSIVYHNLANDRPGTPAKQVSARQQMIQALTDDEVPGTKCTFATVLVEVVRSRVPAPRRGDLQDDKDKLQIRRSRKSDWELIFTEPHDSPPDLQKALGGILKLAWEEEMQRVSL